MSDRTLSGPQGRRPTCQSCRQRKVRCNRRIPSCSHCSRLQLSCVYETRKRRAPIKPPSSRVSPVPSSSQSPAAQRNETPNAVNQQPTNQDILTRLSRVEELIADIHKSLQHSQQPKGSGDHSQDALTPTLVPPTQSSRQVLRDDKARGSYVDNSVFVGLLLDGGASHQTPENTRPPARSSINLSRRSSARYGIAATDVFGDQIEDISIPSQTYTKLWSLYTQNFDPLVKLLHIPTIQPVILNAAVNSRDADDTTMSLLYAVAFAATSTVPRAEAMWQLGFEKSTLLRYFMQQIDSALMRAQFLIRPNTQNLTAFVIYLAALRTYDAGRPVWILTGLGIRIAESLGVHETGARLGLDPFETEMRCRLWWHLIALDATAPENHGFNSTIVDNDRTSMLPSNIDDFELSPQMTNCLVGKEEWTEMSFSIVSLDLCRSLRRAALATTGNDAEIKVGIIQEAERKINQKWMRFADMTKPVCRAADALLRISVLKAHFVLTLQTWLSTTKSTDCKYRQLPHSAMTTAIQLLEDGYLLQSGNFCQEFAWFYQQSPQLYALFLVLRTLHASPELAEADRAWVAVDNYFTCLTDFEEASEMKGRTSCVWTVLGPLRDKARESCSRMIQTKPGLKPIGESSKYSPTRLSRTSPPIVDGLSPLPNAESDIHSFYQASHLALEPSDFDNILAWQEFPDWFNMDTGLR